MKNICKKLARKISLFLFDKRLPFGVNKPIRHILLINWNGRIGDAIVSSFFYREIRKLDNVIISVITTEQLRILYSEYYNVNNVFIVSDKLSYFELYNISKKIKDVDTIVPLMGYLNMKNLFFISRVNPVNLFSLDDELGFSNIQMGKKTDKFFMHEIFYFILTELGVKKINDEYIVPQIGKHNTEYNILFNPFASRLDKSFSIQKSVDILTRLISKYDTETTIGILSSPNTKNIAYDIVKKVNCKNLEVVEHISSFYDAIDVIKNSNIIISIDTALVHIASGLNKKLIAIYYKQGTLYNAWLPKKSINTQIIFSLGTEKHKVKDMNNFSDNDIVKAIDNFGKFKNAEK